MKTAQAGPEVERLIQLLAKLPGLGPRSARRAALQILKRKAELLEPLAQALSEAGRAIRTCSECGNLDTSDPCTICRDPSRDAATLCVVEDVGDLPRRVGAHLSARVAFDVGDGVGGASARFGGG